MAHIERRPIRYDTNAWLVMRNDEVLPKAIIRRALFKEWAREVLHPPRGSRAKSFVGKVWAAATA